MRKTQLFLLALLLFGISITGVQVSKAQEVEQPVSRTSHEWSTKMKALSESLVEIVRDVSSNEKFNSTANYSKIEGHAKKLASLAHDLEKKGMKSPDSDPTVKILSSLFSDEAQHAYQELKRGHRNYARSILRSISGYCVSCHTRNHAGPDFQKLTAEMSSSGASSIELGEFYAATRQFDLALAEFRKVTSSSSLSLSRPFEWERAVEQSLSIAVRFKQDPALGLDIVEQVVTNKNAPYFFRQNADQWKRSLIDWKNETPRKALTEEGLYSEALRLTAEAHRLQKYPLDRSADIIYLRASAAMHQLLQVAPEGRHAGEAFLLAGLCYEVLKPLNLEELHEIYYEACIKKVPHSTTAELCFHRYEESIYVGYTGSGGTDIPQDIKEKLSKLETLARTSPVQQN